MLKGQMTTRPIARAIRGRDQVFERRAMIPVMQCEAEL